MRRRAPTVVLLILFVATFAYVLLQREAATTSTGGGEARIVEAFRSRSSGLVVEASGEVVRILADDDEGSRHQRFVVEMSGGHTVLIAHNIDIAPRVPLDKGASVTFRGEYEWNERGGVVHWTHHDPQGRRQGGWIRFRGDLYR